jgi:hypothetical protein
MREDCSANCRKDRYEIRQKELLSRKVRLPGGKEWDSM